MTTSPQERLLSRLARLSADKLDLVEQFLNLLDATEPVVTSTNATDARSTSESQRLAAQIAASAISHVPPQERDWPHAPLHRISHAGTYLVTAGTLHKEHYFRGSERLDVLESTLLSTLKTHGWQIEAWAVFSNHYHFVAHCGNEATKLNAVLKQLHGVTARTVNQLDGAAERQVWHNYWDTALTYEKSYLARLNYVHQNAVRHGLAPVANQYRWCSAAWFEQTATAAQVKTIYGFKIDKLRVRDDFDPL